MNTLALLTCFALAADAPKPPEPLTPGEHRRTVVVGEVERTFLVHVPTNYDHTKPTPVVLCYHGAATNGLITVALTGLNAKADAETFIAVYPNGTGRNGVIFVWNSGGIPSGVDESKRDDVAFTRQILDDLTTVSNVDPKRVFATGISNGGMMCHRLAVELSDRIAAIAPVAGTLALEKPEPKRAVPVLQIHGTADTFVAWNGPGQRIPKLVKFRSVDDTIKFWVEHDACVEKPIVEALPDKSDDGTTVSRTTYAGGKQGSEVVLVKIDGGGHTWPGREMNIAILGRTTKDIAANDLIWEFFKKHPMP
ncbi:MAG: polyhydroxybutyrate depolymerase [Planctomycetia bacterium]|nr:polyhydroxybutyrate depolymerase [Planctomycetia bacterium]